MDKFDRIYALHGLLSHHRHPVSLALIQSELECSAATAKRIIAHMRLYLDAPIQYDRQRRGYFYDQNAERPFELPGIWFNTSELYALLAAQSLLKNVDPGLFHEQLQPLQNKIGHILEHAGRPYLENLQRIRILSQASRRCNDQIFRRVASAVLERKRLYIHYRGRISNRSSRRELSPQRLAHYRDNWYLDAWCHLRQSLRTFAVERIEHVQVLSKAASNIDEERLEAYFSSAYGIFSGPARAVAVLHFTPERARWVAEEQWHSRQQSRWLANGYFELRIPYGDPTELIMDILKYGDDVEVIAPESLRQAIRQRIQAMQALYR